MQFSISATLFALLTLAVATPTNPLLSSRQNAGRPVANGACCVAATSLKQDVCNVNGQTGRCVPAGVNNCKLQDSNKKYLKLIKFRWR